MMRSAAPAGTRLGGDVARRELARDAKGARRRLRCARRVGGVDGVAVHRRVVERRDVEGRDDILGEHLAERVEEGAIFGLAALDITEDALERLVDADHA